MEKPVKKRRDKKSLIFGFLLAVLVIGLFESASAVPQIETVLGNVSDGKDLTITGSSFETKETAEPFRASYMHPDEEMNFQETGEINESYWSNAGVYLTNNFTRLNNRDYINLKYCSVDDTKLRTYNLPMNGIHYFSWYDYMDPEVDWTNMETGAVATKYVYFNAGGHPHDTISIMQDGRIFGGMYVGGETREEQDENLILPFGGGYYGRPGSWVANYELPLGQWNFFEVFYNMSSAPEVYDGWMELRINNQRIWRANNVNTYDDGYTNEPGFEDIALGGNYGWYGENQIYERYYGEVYYDDTFSRVVLGDNPIYENCNHLELQVPYSWDDNSIDFRFNQGSFNGGEQTYLFVIDSENNPSEGYPITIGEKAINEKNYSGRICFEDFENISEGPLPENNPTYEIDYAARPFWGTAISGEQGGIWSGFGNPGKAAVAHVGPYTDGRSYSEPKFRWDNRLNGSQTVYMKFNIRIDENLGTSNANREIYNFKLFLVTDNQDASSGTFSEGIGRIQMNFEPSDDAYSMYSPCAGDDSFDASEYYFYNANTKLNNSLMDNQWHTLEVFIDIGNHVSEDHNSDSDIWDDPDNNGIVSVWQDGYLILNDTNVPIRCSENYFTEINSMAFIRHAKALGAPVDGMNGHIYFDNLEVWDRMPPFSDEDNQSNQTQYHPADTNPPNGVISFTEIEAYMNRWLNGEITIDELLSGINEWRGFN